MEKLKNYQERSIKEFEAYLDLTVKLSSTIGKSYDVAFNTFKKPDTYKDILNNLDVPFVCIKIPTGGGKTIVAVYMVNSLYEKFFQNKRNSKGLVVWSVPSTAILSQTLSNLKDRNHWYRETLDKFFSNNVKIFNFKEALKIKKSDIVNNLCIFVTTFGAVRITNKDKRKAFQDNGDFLEHFQGINGDFLEKDTDGTVKNSLINVIKLANPILIIDEGHNTKTKLSYNMIRDMRPSFVLEYTATPRRAESNVLVNVTTQELKDENMVKIPINLHTVAKWEQTIRYGVEWRKKLEKIAKKEKNEYIRPIALIQAQQEKVDKDKVYVQKIYDFLINDRKILESQIVIKTATQDQLTGIDLYSPDCKIRYIITVNALREGWDNNFPYILISLCLL